MRTVSLETKKSHKEFGSTDELGILTRADPKGNAPLAATSEALGL